MKYVFDTHHNGDHAYGNAVWTQAGAVTIAYQGVADEMKRYEHGRPCHERHVVSDSADETFDFSGRPSSHDRNRGFVLSYCYPHDYREGSAAKLEIPPSIS